MQRSLSILMPVHNVQATLAAYVSQVLEVAGELTDALEILIIDNGSSDHTLEVAHDLAVCFPQVQVMRFNARRDCQQVIRSGLERTSGDVVLAHDGGIAANERNLTAIGRLWEGEWTGPPQHGWYAVDRPEMNSARFRADGNGAHDQLPRPNFLTKLRNLALGE